ncbi:MAG: YIP1 family protein [Candidatus Micrarchaeia archaeon]
MASAAKERGVVEQAETFLMGAVPVFPGRRFLPWMFAYFHPAEAFAAQKKNAKFMNVLAIIAIALLMECVAAIIVNLALFDMASRSPASILAGLIITMAFEFALFFVLMAVYFALAKLLGGKGKYMEQSLGLALITGAGTLIVAPLQILTVIPCINLVATLIMLPVGIYSLYSQYRMIRAVHRLSRNRAIVVTIVPALALFAMSLVLVYLTIGPILAAAAAQA